MFPDFHFLPMTKMCGFCLVDYDFIGKMETWERDASFILQRTGLSSSKEASEEVVNSSKGGSTDERARQFWSTLSEEQTDFLKQYYKNDCEMFGYNFEQF